MIYNAGTNKLYTRRLFNFFYYPCDKVLARICDFSKNRNRQQILLYRTSRTLDLYHRVQKNKPVVNNENNKIANWEYFAVYPRMSTRKAALESQSPILRILRKDKFHPYTFSIVQRLKALEFPRKVEFSKNLSSVIIKKCFFLTILFGQM